MDRNSAAITAISASLLLTAGAILTACGSLSGSAARAEGSVVAGSSEGGEPGSSGASEPGSIGGGEPGSVGGSDAGSSGAAATSGTTANSGNSGSGDTAVSSGPLGEQHEWTQEEMLLARPMPMSQEERDYAFKHKAPESIRTWTLGEFQEFTNTAMGRNQLLQEGRRWVSIKNDLKEQLALGQEFLAGGGKKPKKAKANPDGSGKSDAGPLPDYLVDEGVFQGAESATTFDHLKECRQDITDLCRAIDGVKKTASKRGRLEAMEKYMSGQ